MLRGGARDFPPPKFALAGAMPRRGPPPAAPAPNEGAQHQPHRIFHGQNYWGGGITTDADAAFANALRTQGFALLAMGSDYMQQMQVAGERRFALQPETKLGLARTSEDGYVRCPHKELFHFGPDSDALHSNRHVRTAPAAFRDEAMCTGRGILKLINRKVLKQTFAVLPAEDEKEALSAWYGPESAWPRGGGTCSVDASVITHFLYSSSNPQPLHSAAHVDKGLLTLCYNPLDIEICVDGEWIIPSAQNVYPDGVILVMVGYTLERASAGVFRAALHRVRNRGRRQALVAKIRAAPRLVINPRIITTSLLAVQGSTDSFTVGDLQSLFEEAHESVNASVEAGHLAGATLQTQQPTHGVLSLTTELLLMIVGQLKARELASLRRVCCFLDELASLEQLWVPMAERTHIDWNLALDRIDTASPSIGRWQEPGTAMPAALLLEQARPQLHAIVCAEAFDHVMFGNSFVAVKVVTQDGNEVHFKTKMNTPMQKLMHAFCTRQGVSTNSVRFLFDGNRLNETQTPLRLGFENNEIIDVMVEQQGD